ncbi:MAG: hypothetical protein ACI3U0_06230 [Oscillospiraceae bacterium]
MICALKVIVTLPFRHPGNKKTLAGKSGQGAAARHKDTVIPSYDALPAALYRLKEVFSDAYTTMSSSACQRGNAQNMDCRGSFFLHTARCWGKMSSCSDNSEAIHIAFPKKHIIDKSAF